MYSPYLTPLLGLITAVSVNYATFIMYIEKFSVKMSSCQYRKSHCGDKTVVRSSYLHNGISYTGKISSLYWIVQFADVYGTDQEANADMFIGLDSCWKFVRPQIISSADGQLMALCTVFGRMFYGNVSVSESCTERIVSEQLLCMNVLDQGLRTFWELESLVIPAHKELVSCDPTLLKF